jgi:hypothetical protein
MALASKRYDCSRLLLLPGKHSGFKGVRRTLVSSSCHGGAAVCSGVDARLLAGVGISRCVFLVGAGDHRLPNEKDPKLLGRRVHAGPTAERETSQKIIQSITSLGFIAMLVIPALDRSFVWSKMSLYLEVAGEVLVAIGFLIVFLVYKKIPLRPQLSNSSPNRKSYRRDSMHSYVIPCIWEPFSGSLACLSRLARGGDCSCSSF